MTKLALFVRLEAKPGQEAALADFLASALPLANAESGTTAWFALKFGPSTFGVFDAFADEAGRQAHLNGQIAAALMANAATLLSSPPNIEKVELTQSGHAAGWGTQALRSDPPLDCTCPGSYLPQRRGAILQPELPSCVSKQGQHQGWL